MTNDFKISCAKETAIELISKGVPEIDAIARARGIHKLTRDEWYLLWGQMDTLAEEKMVSETALIGL
jgi:hypothetical protein